MLIVLDRRPTGVELDNYAEMGLDDMTFGTERGLPVVECDVEGRNLLHAIYLTLPRLEALGLNAVAIYAAEGRAELTAYVCRRYH